MRIGVDVGGTNTDAVLMSGDSVLGWCKSTTSPDIAAGVVAAIRTLLEDAACDPEDIVDVMWGTTHFTNSLIERKGLLEVAVLRLACPSGYSVPPKLGWPLELSKTVGDHVFILPGGYEYDGRQISAFDEEKVRSAAVEIKRRGLKAAAISSTFASLNPGMERRAGAILLRENRGIRITLSSDIGRLGLYERENSAILNAALTDLSRRVVDGFESALSALGIRARLHMSQNDGTLMRSSVAKKFPILTFASGPTNSMRGAAFLSGTRDALVMDVGGTSSDVGVLRNGFPRESTLDVDIGGVRTNFRMPDIVSVPAGGGTIFHGSEICSSPQAAKAEDIVFGPESVGSELTRHALVFGGDTLTATDVAVAMNPRLEIGDRQRVRHITGNLAQRLESKMHEPCQQALEYMQVPGDVPLILVGGGHVLVRRALHGCSRMTRPKYASVANAIGAAIAEVGGEIDRIYSYESMPRVEALDDAKRRVSHRLVRAGGDLSAARFVDIEETALSYMPGGAVRVRVKAVAGLSSIRSSLPVHSCTPAPL